MLLLRSALYYIPYLTFLQEKNEFKKNPSATHHIGGQNFTEWWSPYMFLENIVGGAAAAAQPCMILEFFWTFGYFRYKFFCVFIQIYILVVYRSSGIWVEYRDIYLVYIGGQCHFRVKGETNSFTQIFTEIY